MTLLAGNGVVNRLAKPVWLVDNEQLFAYWRVFSTPQNTKKAPQTPIFVDYAQYTLAFITETAVPTHAVLVAKNVVRKA
jgi:hypothetical protein